MRPGDIDSTEEFVIDHDNWPAWEIFQECRTQWIIGINGLAGLNYVALELVMGWCGITGAKEQGDMWRKVRLIERGMLAGLRGVKWEVLFDGTKHKDRSLGNG